MQRYAAPVALHEAIMLQSPRLTRSVCWTSIALLAVAASACDSPSPTQNSDRIDDPNVTVLSGADVVTTDTAVLVNGDRWLAGYRTSGCFVPRYGRRTDH